MIETPDLRLPNSETLFSSPFTRHDAASQRVNPLPNPVRYLLHPSTTNTTTTKNNTSNTTTSNNNTTTTSNNNNNSLSPNLQLQ